MPTDLLADTAAGVFDREVEWPAGEALVFEPLDLAPLLVAYGELEGADEYA
jgi:hypothetical protein